jgi:glycosyltransferase involved in cell wall biosynthesis
MTVILSPYPVSKSSIGSLQPADGTRFLTLSELRIEPVGRMLKRLRGLHADTLRIVLQERSERAVLPLMLSLAALARAGRIEVHDLASGSTQVVGRLRAALGVVGILWASHAGWACALWLGVLTRSLLRQQPLVFDSLESDKALYLKTNLMLGAKAGGSIGHIAGVANEFVRRNPASLMMAPEWPPLLQPESRFSEIPALQAYGVPPELNHFRFNAVCKRAAEAALKRERFGFIYQRLTLGNLAGVLLSRRFRIPLVLEYNGSEVWVSQNWGHKLKLARLAQAVEDVCLRHAHRVVTVSQVLADELVARGVPAQRVVWYPNCIDPAMFDPSRHEAARQSLRSRLGIADDDVVVLFIGTFGMWHGAETLAEAAKLTLTSPGVAERPRLRFVFVGDGLRLPNVRAMLAREIAAGAVILTGLVPQHEAPAYLAMADIFSSPHIPAKDGSKFFGSPTKLFEYMAMERPIIASDLDQLADVLKPAISEAALNVCDPARGDETAVLTEPGSAHAIARAISALQLRPALRTSLGAAGRRRALHHYTWAQHVDVIMSSLGARRQA